MEYADTLKKVQDKLFSKGARSIRGLERIFKKMDSYDGNKKLDKNEFFEGLNDYGCNVSKEEVN